MTTVSPQIGAFTFGNEPVNAGDVASVTCVVTKGDFPMDIDWMFQNQPIDEKRQDIIISNVGKRGKQLSIEAVGASHAGEYTCIASNSAGTTTRTAILDVNGTVNIRLTISIVLYFDYSLLIPVKNDNLHNVS